MAATSSGAIMGGFCRRQIPRHAATPSPTCAITAAVKSAPATHCGRAGMDVVASVGTCTSRARADHKLRRRRPYMRRTSGISLILLGAIPGSSIARGHTCLWGARAPSLRPIVSSGRAAPRSASRCQGHSAPTEVTAVRSRHRSRSRSEKFVALHRAVRGFRSDIFMGSGHAEARSSPSGGWPC